MLGKLVEWLKRTFPVLFDEKMPVWMTILASLAAAGLTYFIAPSFNRQFQIADVRSAHLTKATDQINSDMIELSQCIRQFNSSLSRSGNDIVNVREKCLDTLTKIQWRLVDVRVILVAPNDSALVTDYANTLTDLKRSLDAPMSEEYVQNLGHAMAELTKSSQKVLDRLYLRAALKE
jgi:hypothetical protein